MDKKQIRVMIKSVIALLESVRKLKVKVLANPYEFEGICETLERRAAFLRNYMTNRRKKARVIVRKRLFYPGGGRGTALTIVEGLPAHKSGRKVCHPNGKPWTRIETAAEVAQLAYKAPPEQQP